MGLINITPLESLITFFIVIGFIKLIFIFTNKKAWYEKVVKGIYGNPTTGRIIMTVLAAIVLSLLIQEISIVQIFGSMLLMASLFALVFLSYSKEFLEFANKIYSKKLSRSAIIVTLVWLALVIWVLYEIFVL